MKIRNLLKLPFVLGTTLAVSCGAELPMLEVDYSNDQEDEFTAEARYLVADNEEAGIVDTTDAVVSTDEESEADISTEEAAIKTVVKDLHLKIRQQVAECAGFASEQEALHTARKELMEQGLKKSEIREQLSAERTAVKDAVKANIDLVKQCRQEAKSSEIALALQEISASCWDFKAIGAKGFKLRGKKPRAAALFLRSHNNLESSECSAAVDAARELI